MPDRYAVFGHPIHHSKSPFIHRAFAAQTGQDLEYTAIDASPEHFAATVRTFFTEGGKGANVTVPHKEAALALAADATPRAQEAGAANTLFLTADGAICADNTDGVGLIRDLTNRWGLALEGKRILLLGAGGAAKGILAPLIAARPCAIMLANRTAARAEALVAAFAPRAAQLGVSLTTLPWAQLAHPAATPPFDLVLNATSASLTGSAPPLSPTLWAPDATAYDLMYGATPTPFLVAAQHQGAARTIDGLGMLVEQAAESFWLWRGVRPETEPVYQALRAQLGALAAR
ncbi:shikimate dehydrogenase [Hydrogenophilus thiooxidans]|uniref:shikimate dehydrogenase n=1 Tax=Hydrogenophilus thiooxidans TaxID=2820326 RepID=UPI001C245581|nr:shikimate dehydrogenase [Hydrogenophilus thiooxidans]